MKRLFPYAAIAVLLVATILVSLDNNGLRKDLETLSAAVEAQEVEIASIKEKIPDQGTHVGGVEIGLREIQTIIPQDEFIAPSSPHGPRYSPFSGDLAYHDGLDFYGVWHCEVMSPGDGIIKTHYVPPGQIEGYVGHDTYGGMLEILLDSGETILLGHLSSTYVHEGQRVKKGHVVGRQGSTGKSTGEHVHMGVTMADGSSKNPFVWFMENANE